MEIDKQYLKDGEVDCLQGLRLDEDTEVYIVRMRETMTAEEILIIPGYASRVLGSPSHIAILNATENIRVMYEEVHGRGNVDLLYVSSRSFDELDQGADYGEFGEFLETIDIYRSQRY